jgi:plastocyanin
MGAQLLVVLVLAFGAVVFAAGPLGAATTKTVQITDTGFGPPTLEVESGDTVVWTNDGTATHDVSADDGTFQSGPMSPGQTFTFVFETQGTFVYRSTTDSSLTGSIMVGGDAVGSAQSASPFVATDNVPATAGAASPDAFAYTGAAESIALAVLGTVALLFGWAVITGFGSPIGRLEPWRILALADPRRLGFTDELMPRGRWRRTPRRSRQADLLPGSARASQPTVAPTTDAPATRASRRSRRATRSRSTRS